MTLAPALGPVGGTRPRLVTAVRGTDGTTIHDRPRPINLVTANEPIQQREVDQIPHARPLPIAQAGASTSSPTRTRAPAGASAREYRCEGRRQCLRGTRDPRRAAAHPVAVGGESARTARQDPTTDLEAAWRPCLFTLPRRQRIKFRRFCYTLLAAPTAEEFPPSTVTPLFGGRQPAEAMSLPSRPFFDR